MAKQPMNKFVKFILWAVGLFAGAFVLLLIAAAIIIPIVLPPAKLKTLATDWVYKNLHHRASVGDVRFNVLSGFSVKNLVIANRAGWDSRPLVAAKDISISYHLFPLLWGQVSLGEIRLNNPDILVEHRNPNQFNFSDMTGDAQVQAAPAPAPKSSPKSKSKSKSKPKKKKKHAALPVSEGNQAYASFFVDSAWADTAPQPSKSTLLVSVDSLNIIHGKLEYLDETASPVKKSTASDLNLKVKNISMVGGKTTFTLDSPLSSSGFNLKLAISGSLRFFLSGMAIKGLDLTGDVSGNGFKFTGDASDLSTNFTPNIDGEASLDILKFLGLVPHSLSSMPQGLSLDGPAKVDFHLGGSLNNGLELSGTADGTGLAIKYKDLFVKTNKTTCTIDFKTVNKVKQGVYDVPSFKVVYADWAVTGAFHYAGTSWSCQVHSKSLPFKGLPGMLPKMKNTTVDGEGTMDLSFVSTKGKATLPFLVNGAIGLKNVGITLPQEPYLESMNGSINCVNNIIKVPGITFKAFDGTGVMGVTFNGNNYAYNYGFRLSSVNAQKAVDASIDAYVTTKDFSKFKDILYGEMNLAYAGSGKGTSGDAMMASQVGSGNYSLDNAQLKGDQVKTVTKFFKDDSGQISFEQIKGNLSMKNKVFSYTADTSGKIGAIRENGGIDVVNMVYSPDMTIRCDLKKEVLNSDAIQAAIPDGIRSIINPIIKSGTQLLDCIADDGGNVPVDEKFTGKVSDNNHSYDWSRAKDNALKKGTKALQNAAQPVIQNLGNQLKGLFH